MDLLLSHCREKSEMVPLLCRLLCLESLLLPVCISLTLVARELSMWRKPFFFHLTQVHGKKLVRFSFLEDERRWFREKWLDQGGRPNALTAPHAPTGVGTYLWWEVSLLLASFPSNPLKSLGKGSLYIILPLCFISLCMTIGPLPLPSPHTHKKHTLLGKHNRSYVFPRLPAIFSSYHDSKPSTPLRKT